MKELNCHSGTKKMEVIDFLKANKGSVVNIHYENNISSGWGDDSDRDFELTDQGLEDAIQFVKMHYIHNLKVKL